MRIVSFEISFHKDQEMYRNYTPEFNSSRNVRSGNQQEERKKKKKKRTV